jgi:cyclopropane fatty-acyl-phospholipid synthase-like methyltransferase
MDWYRLVYGASYRLGFTPWDRGTPASGLVDLVAGPSALPRGRALDLGCGSGTNTIYLCKHGWETTGVDMVPRALDEARQNAARSGVSPRLILGDVTCLRDIDLGVGFNLFVDVGCFHTLPATLRNKYVESVSSLAAPGATLFLYAFSPRRLTPMKSGTTQDEIAARFTGWSLTSAEASPDGTTAPGWRGASARYFGPRQYRLHRTT